MAEAGIDMNKYNTHRCRSAASTGMLYTGFELVVCNLQSILAICDWVFAFFLKIANC